MYLWVDDIRHPPIDNHLWDWAVSSDIAIARLGEARELGEKVDLMSLDHDLGGDDTTRPVVLWMCENDFWPDNVVVHSQNPVGCDWLIGMINRYKPQVDI